MKRSALEIAAERYFGVIRKKMYEGQSMAQYALRSHANGISGFLCLTYAGSIFFLFYCIQLLMGSIFIGIAGLISVVVVSFFIVARCPKMNETGDFLADLHSFICLAPDVFPRCLTQRMLRSYRRALGAVIGSFELDYRKIETYVASHSSSERSAMAARLLAKLRMDYFDAKIQRRCRCCYLCAAALFSVAFVGCFLMTYSVGASILFGLFLLLPIWGFLWSFYVSGKWLICLRAMRADEAQIVKLMKKSKIPIKDIQLSHRDLFESSAL